MTMAGCTPVRYAIACHSCCASQMTMTEQDDCRHFGIRCVRGTRMQTQPRSSRIAFLSIPYFPA